MQVSPEIISGKLVTIIRRPFEADKVRESLERGVPVVVEAAFDPYKPTEIFRSILVEWNERVGCFDAYEGCVETDEILSVLTILPPLPRRPTAEDAGLLHRYASEGLFVEGKYEHCTKGWVQTSFEITMRYVTRGMIKDAEFPFKPIEVFCAINAQGERVEVAFVGGDDEQAG